MILIYLFIYLLKSSPHLIEVRERIKINGESLSYNLFTEYYSHCHKLLIQDAVRLKFKILIFLHAYL